MACLLVYTDAHSVAKPLVFTLMEFLDLPEYTLKPGLAISFQCAFRLPMTSSPVHVKKWIFAQYAFFGKDTSMLKNMN